MSYGILGIVVVILSFWLLGNNGKDTQKTASVSKERVKSSVGISVGDTEKLEFMKGLQKNYYDFEDRIKATEEQVKDIRALSEQLRKDQQIIVGSLTNIREELANNAQTGAASKAASFELAIAPIKNVDADNDYVYLPLGSFCKGTLLTGVYASSDMNSPLPVLITLDEAFYGPNKTRIPLKGAYALGKAVGDINSERALIQITAISFVFDLNR